MSTATIATVSEDIAHVKQLAIALERGQRKRAPTHRGAGIVARLHTCVILAQKDRRNPADYAREHFPHDRDLHQLIELRSAVAPAQTTVAGWASELVTDTVQDIADNLLTDTVLTQLRARGLAYNFIAGAALRAPVHSPVASGAFIGEAGAIPLGQLLLTSLSLKPRKAASIIAATKELFQGSPRNVELSFRTLLSEDLSIMVDGVLLSANAASAASPPGLLNGIASLTPSPATGGALLNAVLTDIKALLAAIAPAIRPVLIMGTGQAASLSIIAPNANAAVIVAPFLGDGTVIAIDASQFASALGLLDLAASESATLHMDTAPLPLSATGSPNVVAAPTRSLFQTASVGLRAILECDWVLRRPNAIAFVSGVQW